MIKRTTAKFHILIVSILLVAHAVIPHVHFDNEIVITGSHDHQTKENCKHNHHQHSDEDDADANFCLLKQVYLARSNDTDSGDDAHGWLNTQNNRPDAQFAVLQFSENYSFGLHETTSDKIHIPLFYSYLGSGNINSRGSPLA